MTPEGREVPDTDWHVGQLYEFVTDLGANLQIANYSRYVVDLNRPASDEALYAGQVATGLCPTQTFAGDEIYVSGDVGADEMAQRVKKYWCPYHEHLRATLDAIRERHGYALLWEAHSIASVVPRLFDGELPELNIGTNGGLSCGPELESAVVAVAEASPYGHVLNDRFQGGFITRHYGDPDHHVHAVQLEIAQRVYMNETSHTFDARKATQLRDTLRQMLESFIQIARLKV
jgi:N-formylglutamate amidohydrolase